MSNMHESNANTFPSAALPNRKSLSQITFNFGADGEDTPKDDTDKKPADTRAQPTSLVRDRSENASDAGSVGSNQAGRVADAEVDTDNMKTVVASKIKTHDGNTNTTTIKPHSHSPHKVRDISEAARGLGAKYRAERNRQNMLNMPGDSSVGGGNSVIMTDADNFDVYGNPLREDGFR